MNDKEWKKQSNERLKKRSSIYVITNKIELYFLRLYFVITVLILIGLGIFAYKFLQPYFQIFLDRTPDILNFLNNTV